MKGISKSADPGPYRLSEGALKFIISIDLYAQLPRYGRKSEILLINNNSTTEINPSNSGVIFF